MKKSIPLAVMTAATLSAALGGTLGCVRAATPAPIPQVAKAASKDSAPPKPPKPEPPNAPKPYATVITPEAKTQRGLLTTHRFADKLLFEIPKSALNIDLLLVGRYARAAADQGQYAGDQFAEVTLRWERVGNRVFLRRTSYRTVADSTLAVGKAVAFSNTMPIIAVFDAMTFGPDSAAVIDVTRLYTTPMQEFAAIKGAVDPMRSFIDRVTSFPENVEIEATQTGMAGGGPGVPPTTQTVVAHWSMIKLPTNPMMPRLMDERIGYFGFEQADFGTKEHRVAKRSYIARWRLEKKDPSAALSEPVKPIVYYIDPATPDQWKPWVRRAILSWQPAFEAAGFKNAIIAADPPADDSTWSPEDVRNTVIRWLPSPEQNAQGPHVHDPRTGEILNGSIRMFHNILNLQRNWYFTQVAPLDPRAQRWPMPDSLIGRLLEYVVAHEIGHTLGLRHDQLGSSLYPADSVRSKTWVAKMGHTPSIMDYSRFNYVAQPEDGIALEDLIPRVGPYDLFAIRWGYTPIPSARTSMDERAELDRWARIQDTVPYLRFAEFNAGGGFGTETEAVGDADPVWATGWGMKNIKRVMKLIPAAAIIPGQDNDDLNDIYTATVGQWARELSHVASVVGGSMVQLKSGSQLGPVYRSLGKKKQQAAVRFLNANAFSTPTYMMDPAISRRLEPEGMLTRISGVQAQLLSSLLSGRRLSTLLDEAAMPTSVHHGDVYTMTELLTDVRQGVWSELSASSVTIDPYRRALQSAYIADLAGKVGGGGPMPPQMMIMGGGGPSDIAAAARAELGIVRGMLRNSVSRASDTMTRRHLEASFAAVDRVLNPNAQR